MPCVPVVPDELMESVRVRHPSHHPRVMAQGCHGVSLDGEIVAVVAPVLGEEGVYLKKTIRAFRRRKSERAHSVASYSK